MSNPTGLYLKLHNIMKAIKTIPKDKRNVHFNYDYASEEIIKKTLQPLLIKEKVLFVIGANDIQLDKIINKAKNEEYITHIKFTYKFIDIETGEFLEGGMIGSGYDSTDKGTYKAITGAIKYILTSTFLIPTGGDPEDDAGDKSKDRKTKTEPKKSAPKCEKCGKDMTIHSGKHGDFWACTGYPQCRNTKQIGKTQPAKEESAGTDGELDETGKKQVAEIHKIQGYLGWNDETYRAALKDRFGKESSKDLTNAQRTQLI